MRNSPSKQKNSVSLYKFKLRKVFTICLQKLSSLSAASNFRIGRLPLADAASLQTISKYEARGNTVYT